jgi:hypothetical protein
VIQQPFRVLRLFSGIKNMKKEAELDWPLRQRVSQMCEPLGAFATVSQIKNISFPLPMVAIEGVGQLSFPLMDVAVEPLKAALEQVTLGEGRKALQHGTDRKDWRIDASQVTLGGGDEWDELLKSTVKTACHRLGFSNDRINDLGVHAIFKELLLQETEGHLTRHTTAENEMGSFGTLVIQLPSQFTGDELSVRHAGETKRFDLAYQCAEQYKLIAFYADCEHQLHPITSGICVCLVFNLFFKKEAELDWSVRLQRVLDTCEPLGHWQP